MYRNAANMPIRGAKVRQIIELAIALFLKIALKAQKYTSFKII